METDISKADQFYSAWLRNRTSLFKHNAFMILNMHRFVWSCKIAITFKCISFHLLQWGSVTCISFVRFKWFKVRLKYIVKMLQRRKKILKWLRSKSVDWLLSWWKAISVLNRVKIPKMSYLKILRICFRKTFNY